MRNRRTIILAFYYLLLLVSLHFPIGVLFLFSLNDGVVFAFPLKGLTVHWYRDMLGNSEMLKAALNSLLVALSSSLVATALGAAAAIALLRFQFKGKAAIVALALVPLLVPYLILGAALLVLFTGLGFQRSLWTVGAGHLVI